MNLIPWKTRSNQLATRDSFDRPLELFRREMDRLMEDFFRGWPAGPDSDGGSQRFWDFGVEDRDNELAVRAEVPGFEPEELSVDVRNDVLTVKAEKKEDGDGRQSYRSYFRSVTLPSGVDADKAQATYRNGVLQLVLPKSEQVQPKRIKVQLASATPQLTSDPGRKEKKAGQGQTATDAA